MYIAITLRYDNLNDRELFVFSKNIKDVCDMLNITLVPICQTSNIDALVSMCDGLIITGSPIHVNSNLYNEKNITRIDFAYGLEDDLDITLINKFTKQNKKILGICRGLQVLNVYYGGSLIQKIDNHEGINHYVNINQNSILKKVYKENIVLVNSSHIQAINNLASEFLVSAKSSDGVIEAIEGDNILALQWHPEKNIEIFKKILKEFFL